MGEIVRRAYKAKSGVEVYVQAAGRFWDVMYRGKVSSGRIHHPEVFLPKFECMEEAQGALDKLAAKLRWAPVITCRVCGCTDRFGCEGGCHWVERDLCSGCRVKGEGIGCEIQNGAHERTG